MAYSGEKVLDIRHGTGSYVYQNKFFTYEGEWRDGQKNGFGKMTFGNGVVVEARFVDGEIEGEGKKTWPTGNVYKGFFQKGEMNGRGVFEGIDGEKYVGDFVSNIRKGHGKLIMKDKTVYEGQFDHNRPHGVGYIRYPNGDYYEGEMNLGKIEGKGSTNYASGDTYSGEWRNGLWHGRGRLFRSCSSIVYEGCFLNGKQELIPHKMEITNQGSVEVDIGATSLPKMTIFIQTADGITIDAETGRVITASYKQLDSPIESPASKATVPARKKSIREIDQNASIKRANSPGSVASKGRPKSEKEKEKPFSPQDSMNTTTPPTPAKYIQCPFDASSFPAVYTISQRSSSGVVIFDLPIPADLSEGDYFLTFVDSTRAHDEDLISSLSIPFKIRQPPPPPANKASGPAEKKSGTPLGRDSRPGRT